MSCGFGWSISRGFGSLVAKATGIVATRFPDCSHAGRTMSLQAKQAADFNERHFLQPDVFTFRQQSYDRRCIAGGQECPPYIGPFTVVGYQNHLYILRDDAGGIFHRGVPISHIKPVLSASKQEDVWYVERLLEHRALPGGKFEYKVKWAGQGIEDATWEPDDNILDKNLIKSYLAEHQRLPRTRKSASTPAAMKAQVRHRRGGPCKSNGQGRSELVARRGDPRTGKRRADGR
jgi:hypothetical protein